MIRAQTWGSSDLRLSRAQMLVLRMSQQEGETTTQRFVHLLPQITNGAGCFYVLSAVYEQARHINNFQFSLLNAKYLSSWRHIDERTRVL